MTNLQGLVKFEGSAHFKPEELWSPDTKEAWVHPELIVKLEELREAYGRPIRVSSGYRTKEHNEKVGGAPGSYHVKGMAVDLLVYQQSAFDILKLATDIGFNGVGIQQKPRVPLGKRFIHLDIRPDNLRTIWSY